MKIVFVISSLGSGGAEKVLSLLANNFIEKHKVSIVLLSKSEIFYYIDNDIKIINARLYKPTSSILEKITNNIKKIFILKKIIQNEKADIVISFMTQTNILSIISTKLVHQKIIVSERTNYDFLIPKTWRLLRKVIYKYADILVVQSSYDKKKYNFHKNCEVIFNPLKIEKKSKLERKKIILAVGRFDKNKAFDRLIEIYNNLNTNWKLLIVGDGEERKNFEMQILKLDLQDKVFLEGRRTNIVEYYQKASIFTLSSRMEGFPNVLAEAMSYGCACISFDCLTGPRDIIIDNENGFLVEDNNEEEFTKKLQFLIENQKVREKFSTNGQKISLSLTVDKIAQQWMSKIEEIVCVE